MNTPFKLKYKNSSFPFKGSPAKHNLQTEGGENVIEVEGEGRSVESENINTATMKDIIRAFTIEGDGPYVPHKPGSSAYSEYVKQGVIPKGLTKFDSSTGSYSNR